MRGDRRSGDEAAGYTANYLDPLKGKTASQAVLWLLGKSGLAGRVASAAWKEAKEG
jgi:hypothetical protein